MDNQHIQPQDDSVVTDFLNAYGIIINDVKKRWYLVAIVMVLGFMLGYGYQSTKKPIYKAELTFASESESKGGLSAYMGLASQLGFDLGSAESGAFTGNNLIAMLKSRLLLQKTFLSEVNVDGKPQLLINYLIQSGIYNKDWKNNKTLSTIQFDKNWKPGNRVMDSVLLEVIDDYNKNVLAVERKDKSIDITTVTVKHRNELFSKMFVEQLVKNAIDFYTDYKSSKAKKNVAILAYQVDSVRGLLGYNISTAADLADLNVNPLRQSLKAPIENKRVDIQANTLVYGELLKNYELAKMSLRKEIPFIQIIDTPILPLDNVRMSKLKMGAAVAATLLLLLLVWLSSQALRKSKTAKK